MKTSIRDFEVRVEMSVVPLRCESGFFVRLGAGVERIGRVIPG